MGDLPSIHPCADPPPLPSVVNFTTTGGCRRSGSRGSLRFISSWTHAWSRFIAMAATTHLPDASSPPDPTSSSASGTHRASYASPDDVYLSDLLSYSLERLGREPELLRSESQRLEKQLHGVAVKHCTSFVSVEDGLESVRKEMELAKQRLDKLAKSAPKLERSCQECLSKTEGLLQESKNNRTLMQNHSTVLDLLEIPTLMDTCIRNGNYDEALDLEVFASKLATVNSESKVARMLHQEAVEIKQSMMVTLLDKLKSSIQLPECLRVVGYLRRLGSYSEVTLRLKFLACRESWLQEEVAKLDMEGFGTYDFLKKLTDAHRVHLFDIVMQYRAIFADDASAQDAEIHNKGNQRTFQSDGGVLYSWGSHRVSCYLDLLRRNLPRLTQGNDLASVLEHSMYCGMSLGRVGMDFRELLAPIFETSAESLLANGLQVAVETFQVALAKHDWDPLLASAAAATSAQDKYRDVQSDTSPPQDLLQYYPLAVLVGAPSRSILSALNELRHCAFTSCAESCARLLTSTLHVASLALAKAHKSAGKNAQSVGNCAQVYAEVAVPYVQSCFDRIFVGKGTSVDLLHAVQPLNAIVSKAKRTALKPKT